MQPPIAVAAATEEPDRAPKSMLPTMLAWAKEPGIQPTKSWAKFTRRRAIPPLFIIFPASTKSGIASREKLSTPLFIFCMVIKVIWSQERLEAAATMDEITMPTEIGQPKKSRAMKTANRIIVVRPKLIAQIPPYSILVPVTSSYRLIIWARMMKMPEMGAMAYTRLLGIPRRAENSCRALKASLNPPMVIIKMANSRIRVSIKIMRILWPEGFKLSWKRTRAMWSRLLKA